MKKCYNGFQQFVDESLEGILMAYPSFYRMGNGDRHAILHPTEERKVRIVTGGGYGHLPVFLGYVGEGLCDAVAVGNVFTSPSCEAILNAVRGLESEEGVLFLFGNYFGDSMNFEMAGETLAQENIASRIVKMADDIASAPRSDYQSRRGIAGIAFAYKIAGACAAAGHNLDEVASIAEDTVANTASFGVAFSSCILPGQEKPVFDIAEGEMEIGMGIHGEPGIRRGKLRPADEIVDEMLTPILSDLPFQEGDEVAVLINGLGATPLEEQYVMFRRVKQTLDEKGIRVFHSYVGEYATSMEMAGASISLIRLDDELKGYLSAPADTPFFKQFQL